MESFEVEKRYIWAAYLNIPQLFPSFSWGRRHQLGMENRPKILLLLVPYGNTKVSSFSKTFFPTSNSLTHSDLWCTVSPTLLPLLYWWALPFFLMVFRSFKCLMRSDFTLILLRLGYFLLPKPKNKIPALKLLQEHNQCRTNLAICSLDPGVPVAGLDNLVRDHAHVFLHFRVFEPEHVKHWQINVAIKTAITEMCSKIKAFQKTIF